MGIIGEHTHNPGQPQSAAPASEAMRPHAGGGMELKPSVREPRALCPRWFPTGRTCVLLLHSLEDKDLILFLISRSKRSRNRTAPRPVLSWEQTAGHQDERPDSDTSPARRVRASVSRRRISCMGQKRLVFSNTTECSSAQFRLILTLILSPLC